MISVSEGVYAAIRKEADAKKSTMHSLIAEKFGIQVPVRRQTEWGRLEVGERLMTPSSPSWFLRAQEFMRRSGRQLEADIRSDRVVWTRTK